MIPSFFCLAILASTIRAVPVNKAHARGLDTTSSTLSKRQDDWDVERNELTNIPGVGCKPITVIYARGTIELGNVGELVGPPFFNDLDDLIGAENIAVQGVDYAATIAGYLIGGDPEGAQTTADLLNQAATNCPDTQIVLSGYSQGAMEVHCFKDDFICDDLPVVDTYHLEYVVDTPAAAAFVQGHVSY